MQEALTEPERLDLSFYGPGFLMTCAPDVLNGVFNRLVQYIDARKAFNEVRKFNKNPKYALVDQQMGDNFYNELLDDVKNIASRRNIQLMRHEH